MTPSIIIHKASDGTTRMVAHVDSGSKRYFMLMEHDYITLKFSDENPTLLRLGDYVEIENVGRYEVTKPTKGEYNATTGGYDYEIQLDAQYWKFKNKLFKFLPQIGSNETIWNYTDTLPNHAQQVLFNLRAQAYLRDDNGNESLIPGRESFLYNRKTDWRIEWDDTVDTVKAVTIQYDKLNIIDAISAIAEAYECEWWFEQEVLHFGKCEFGDTPVRLEIGKELVAISPSDSKETYATRLYIYGSDRNLASTYRKELIFYAGGGNDAADPTRPIEPEWFLRDLISQPKQTTLQGRDYDFEANVGYWRDINNLGNDGRWETSSNGCGYLRYEKREGDEWNESDKYQVTNDATMVLRLSEFKPTIKVGDCKNVKAFRLALYISAYNTSGGGYSHTHLSAEMPYEQGATLTAQFGDLFMNDIPNGIHTLSVRLECHALYWNSDPGTWRQRYEFNATVKGNWKTIRFEPLIPQYRADNITLEILNSETGDVERTIEGATSNANFNGNHDITLPGGQTLPVGTQYKLPQIIEAVVPASYFTSQYAALTKYQDITTNGIVNSRLLLPEQDENGNPIKGYIDVFDFESEEEAVEDVVIFEDVYPSRTSKIIELTRSDEYVDEQPEQDGSTTQKKWKAYRYKDDLFNDSNPFDIDNYGIDGVDLQITFQSGLLNGMTFGVAYDTDGRFFEIQRDDTTLLPNEVIKPKVGDEFILHGFNIAMLSDSRTDYVSNAQQELLRKGREYAEKLNTDTSTYQCTVACDVAYEAEQTTPDSLFLEPGRTVNLVHPAYFANGRISRVLGYEIPLDYAYDNPIFIIGEKAQYSRIGEIEDRLDGIGHQTGNFAAMLGGGISGAGASGGGSSVQIIGRGDTTVPSDRNVYSSLRARVEFALKTIAQTISHLWTFLKGIRIGTFVSGHSGAEIDEVGNAEVESLTSRSWLKVQELIYNRLNALEGDTSFADVGTIEQITNNDDGTQTAYMRMRWDGDFTAFQPGDVVYGYVNNLNRV